MSTNFPEELDDFVNPQPTDSVAIVSHAQQHADANDAIEALQAKVGVDNSIDVNSLDYKIRALENASLDTEGIQDIIGNLLTSGNHTNVSVLYDDENNKLNITASLDAEAAMDAIATALTAGTGISKTYDDELNTITISVDTTTIATQEFATQAASGALEDANEYTDLAISGLSGVYDPIGSAAQALSDANEYTDNAISELDFTEEIQDVAAEMITGGTHTNISVTYNDETGKLNFTGSSGLSQEEIQDFVAPLLNHSNHTNITVTYDDNNNRIILQGNAGGGGGASVIISATPPTEPGLGDIWLDSDNGRTYIWDGEFWVEVGAGNAQAIASVLSSPPANPVLGTIWLNTATAKTYTYDGAFWVEV